MASQHPPGAAHRDEPDRAEVARSLREAALEVSRAAQTVMGASTRASAVLASPWLARSSVRHPGTGAAAYRALVRALTRGSGLGFALRARGGPLKRMGQVGEVCGRESLANRVAVTSLRLRVAAVLLEHPELERDPGMRRLMDAVAEDRDVEALRALRAVLRDRGAERALSTLAPLLAELSAIRALLDENPLNDEVGWQIATGEALHADPWLGISSRHLSALDSGEGSAVPVTLEEDDARSLAERGSLMGFLRNIALLGCEGRILIQDVRGPDGKVRHVLQAPGMAPGRPRNDSPQDFIGAWSNLFDPESPYTRGILLAIEEYGVPDGAELAVIGHSEGGIALMNLVQNSGFCRRFRVTHAVTVGSPVDNKRPADPRTWVATVTNQHDLVPTLDGRGAGSGTVFTPHEDWYEVDYTDPSHEFPLCHSLGKYIDNLENDLPDARRDIDEALTPYRGEVVRSQVYQLKDRANPPQGYPLMAVPVTPVATSAGPVEVPVRYYDSTAVVAFFAVAPSAAAELLSPASWMVPTRFGRRVLVALSAYEHRCVSLGPYNELGLAVLVNDLWRPRGYDVVRDLLRRADTRRVGRQVTALAVTTPEAEEAGRELWGHPARTAHLDVRLTRNRLHAVLTGPGDTAAGGAERPLLDFSGGLGPSVPAPHTDSVLYGRSAGTTLRTLVHSAGRQRFHPAPEARLRCATGETGEEPPLVRQLRSLGLDGARPLFVLSASAYQARRGAGSPLPR
ncbi:acetoacetate decarboxylase family protein [Streptomyces sp. TRM76323]|uniref:Acetoacetate decarboxylase family protein n=1 Tax=Streptomyces tamarix TaxID=3078565 RepID=A0ABU3QS59_9ACTN|nr:acetoacetate decarboxylase family protein [Streptomyces tamarix]MDT9685421.1 acetoacetate decarboxylase family protein [Streptomyces tamarix]